MEEPTRVAVVGAGLAGLVAADRLASAGVAVQVLEARSRVGGRLMTVESQSAAGGPFDLGATWHWEDQHEVASLAQSLGLRRFRQFDGGSALHEEPGAPRPVTIEGAGPEPPAFRLDGGCQALAQRLADRLSPGSVHFGCTAVAIETDGHAVAVTTARPDGGAATTSADFVVVAVPPRLVVQNIVFSPPLPDDVVAVLGATPTWMADVVKCVVVYDRPFWREAGLSGSAFSHVGPLYEVHDASAPLGQPAALWGFLADDLELRAVGPAERVGPVLAQLARLFGPDASEPVDYFERDWSTDPNTNAMELDAGRSLAFGHPVFSQPLLGDLGGRLLWAGAETVEAGGGHMEGAVRSGRRAADLILATRGR